jgi:hypothetical protein
MWCLVRATMGVMVLDLGLFSKREKADNEEADRIRSGYAITS